MGPFVDVNEGFNLHLTLPARFEWEIPFSQTWGLSLIHI